jgi:predicted DNA-binding transcriptional regulator AlpA
VSPRLNTEDLIDAGEVASLLGLSDRTAISVYRSRYRDFPLPVVDKGRTKLWHRPAVEKWARATGREVRPGA